MWHSSPINSQYQSMQSQSESGQPTTHTLMVEADSGQATLHLWNCRLTARAEADKTVNVPFYFEGDPSILARIA